MVVDTEKNSQESPSIWLTEFNIDHDIRNMNYYSIVNIRRRIWVSQKFWITILVRRQNDLLFRSFAFAREVRSEDPRGTKILFINNLL